MKRLQGFSLMEMMIVLTIVAIVAAASAPMVNKKMVRAASEKSPWVFTNGESIGYNIDNANGIQDRKTATIGLNGRVPGGVGNPRLYIDINTDTTPHILFGRNGEAARFMKLIAGGDNNNVILSNNDQNASNSVIIGRGTQASNNAQVIIGDGAHSGVVGAVAIGERANVDLSEQALAIGQGATTLRAPQSVAIGNRATTNANRSIGIGCQAKAVGNNSIALGPNASSATDTAGTIGARAIAIGLNSRSVADDTIALGNGASANQVCAIAIGVNSRGVADDTIVLGNGASANQVCGIAIGKTASANQSNTIALGDTSRAEGPFSIAIGSTYQRPGRGDASSPLAGEMGSIAIGSAESTGIRSIAIGQPTEHRKYGMFGPWQTRKTRATGINSIAIGTHASATFENSVAIGYNASAPADNTIVLGNADSIVYIPGRLVVNRTAILGYANNAWQSCADVAIIRSNRDGRMEILQRDGGGDWDAVFAHGRVDSTWATVVLSDRRLKNVGKEFTSGLDTIKKLEVFNYKFKDDKTKTPRVGVIAQDLQKIFPDAVVKGEDGFLRIRMEDMFYAVINAVKELDTRTSAQEKKIQELEKRIEELEKLVKQS